jgi:hypothetical protein
VWVAWGGPDLLLATAATLVVLHWWDGPIAVPGRDDLRDVVWPLAPAVVAFAVLRVAALGDEDRIRLSSRGQRRLRSAIVALALVHLVPVAVSVGDGGRAEVLARNGLLFGGLALIAHRSLRADLAWIPLALGPIVTWLFGCRGAGRPPAAWALPLLPIGSSAAALGTLAAVALGGATYVLAPGAGPGRRCQPSQARRR